MGALGLSARGQAGSILAASASVGAFALFVSLVAVRDRASGPILTPANVLTFSRVGAAGYLCGYAAAPRPGRARTFAWLALLWAATVSDWLDGPVARHFGPTRLGAVLDLEADSWLTLWAAAAAWRSGELPASCLVAPLLRYAVRSRRGLDAPMASEGWQKAAGAAQMGVLACALSPTRKLRLASRALHPYAVIGQLIALAADSRLV